MEAAPGHPDTLQGNSPAGCRKPLAPGGPQEAGSWPGLRGRSGPGQVAIVGGGAARRGRLRPAVSVTAGLILLWTRPPGPPASRAQGSAAVPPPTARPERRPPVTLLGPSPPPASSLQETLFGLPVLTRIRVHRGALKKDAGRSIAEGPVHHVAVSCDPADVSDAAKDISRPAVKHKLQKRERLSGARHPRPHVSLSAEEDAHCAG